ncbi:hypothetical protein E2C01_065971 [Portunus trituberculatus]|uniref:Uncharacterized protein n=1 Tax=Portunus trituberculatus TaxID=210409 RepID=A0A5B7HP12_PORTR|nr:hypothetical protein [Portunus trituberculatus]
MGEGGEGGKERKNVNYNRELDEIKQGDENHEQEDEEEKKEKEEDKKDEEEHKKTEVKDEELEKEERGA